MTRFSAILCVFFLCLVLAQPGCEPAPSGRVYQPRPAESIPPVSPYAVYVPYTAAKIGIIPLTEFVGSADDGSVRIRAYVAVLDSFGCPIKEPGLFRFELYEYVQRSSDPKGKRNIIWPDIDLADSVENNEHWRDFLRAYEFVLPFEPPQADQTYVLQATCICPNGRRLSAEFQIKYPG